MRLLSSPRHRRRLAWAGVLVACCGVVALVVVLLPSHGGPTRAGAPQAPGFGRTTTPGGSFGSSAAEERAAARATRQVRPLANRFVADLVSRRTADAARLASPKLHVPTLELNGTGGTSVAFAGATTVGFVSSFAPDVLLALRFDRTNGRWLATYLHKGHSSSHVGPADYSPPGFAPGSHHETLWTWLALAGGLALVIGAGVAVEHRLR